MLISMWIPKGAALVRGRRLFEARRLSGEIQYKIIFENIRANKHLSKVYDKKDNRTVSVNVMQVSL